MYVFYKTENRRYDVSVRGGGVVLESTVAGWGRWVEPWGRDHAHGHRRFQKQTLLEPTLSSSTLYRVRDSNFTSHHTSVTTSLWRCDTNC